MSEIDLAPGVELPPFERRTGFETWNRFAAVNSEFVPIHMDDEAGKKAGFPGAIGMGNLQWAYYHNLLRQWLSGRGQVERISIRFKDPNLKDTNVRVQGRVRSATPTADGVLVDLELWADDDQDRRLSSGDATVRVRPAQ